MALRFTTLMKALIAGGVSLPAFTVTFDNPVNLTGGGKTNIFMNGSGVGGSGGSGGGGVITTSAVASRTSGVAPLYVNFDATATTSTLSTNPSHELFYAWSFGDSGAGTWANGVQASGLTSKNAAYGPVAGHLFETPGTYTVNLATMDGVNSGAQSFTITVADPNTVYSGTNTICLSSTGNFAGAPSGSQQINTSATTGTDMYAALNGIAVKSNKRILFCKADTWTCSAQNTFTNISGMTISGYGTGAARAACFSASGTDTLVNVTPGYLSGSVFNVDSGNSDLRIHNFKIAANNSTKAAALNANISGMLFSKIEVRGCSAGFSAYPGGGLGSYIEFDQHCMFECLVDDLYGYAGAAANRPTGTVTANGTNDLTLTAHPFKAGNVVQFPTTAPSPLAINTNYVVSSDNLTANTFRLTTTIPYANAGTNSLAGPFTAGSHTLTCIGLGGGVSVFASFVRGGMMGCYLDSCNHGEQTVRLPYLYVAHVNNNFIARPNQGKNIVKIHSFAYNDMPKQTSKFVFAANVLSLVNGYTNGAIVDGATMTEIGDCGILVANGGAGNERGLDGILESNITLACRGNPRSHYFASVGWPTITLRNNIADFSFGVDRTSPYTATDGHISLNFAIVNSSTPVPSVDIRIYNNTLYSNLYNPEVANFVRFSGYATSVVIKNNLWYLKGSNAAINASWKDDYYENTVGFAITPVSSNNTTQIASTTSMTDPLFAVTPPVALADWRPTTGSYAIGSGVAVPVLRDFNNVTRVGAGNNLGAVLP